MKRPYWLVASFLGGMGIVCGILTILDFPNWITGTAVCIGGTIYTIYLGRKDNEKSL